MNIVEEIGIIHNESGFGIIHEVRVDTGEHYARKTFKPIGADRLDPNGLVSLKKRFSREVKIQEKLSSEFCIPIIYSSLDEEEPWFLMPIAEKVFTEEIAESKSEKRTPEGFADILNALEYLHQIGYTHRDIKPGNILYHEGKWKLADMGLITSDPELSTNFVTSKGNAFGSQRYMAPEQFTDFTGVTHHADIYSFGAILHDVYNGRPRQPYAKHTTRGVMGVIIEKCTEERIEDRFDNVSILRDVLLGALSKNEITGKVTDEINQWINDIKDYYEWDSDKLDSFNIYLEHFEGSKSIIYYEITIPFIEHMKVINERFWKRFINNYFKWIETSSFNFDYCDVLIGHINKAYEATDDLSIKSSAIFTSAQLAEFHNRWYVMQQVVKMCSPNISTILAERLAIEIHAIGRNAKKNLIRCVEGISRTPLSYHELIREALV